jgi:hypothetical protein
VEDAAGRFGSATGRDLVAVRGDSVAAESGRPATGRPRVATECLKDAAISLSIAGGSERVAA